MALTNYRIYRWLIYLLEDTDEQHALKLEEINRQYNWDKDKIFGEDARTGRFRTGLPERKVKLKDENGNVLKDAQGKEIIEYLEPKIESKTFLNWRYAIYKYFGLLIQQPVTKERIGRKMKEFVRNRYYLANPELLDDKTTLRETIDMLVDEEKRGWEAKTILTTSPRGRKSKAEGVAERDLSMSFISHDRGDITYLDTPNDFQQEPYMVGLIRFTMSIGEPLVIKYGKALSKEEKAKHGYTDNPIFIFEPYQLKCINGRWYVGGNLYQCDNQDKSRIVIYDVERIQLYEGEDEIHTPAYEVKDGFDMTSLIPNDWKDYFDPEQVVSVCLRVHGSFLAHSSFCPTQILIDEKASHYIYRVYVKPDVDFFIQYMAYGNELSAFDPSKKYGVAPLDITPEQILYLIKLKRGK